MLMNLGRVEIFRNFDALNGEVPDAAQYKEFCMLHTEHPDTAELAFADPFSARYAELAMRLHLDLRGREGIYDPLRD